MASNIFGFVTLYCTELRRAMLHASSRLGTASKGQKFGLQNASRDQPLPEKKADFLRYSFPSSPKETSRQKAAWLLKSSVSRPTAEAKTAERRLDKLLWEGGRKQKQAWGGGEGQLPKASLR